MHNSASEEKEFVKVTATIYDKVNNVIGTETTFANPSTTVYLTHDCDIGAQRGSAATSLSNTPTDPE